MQFLTLLIFLPIVGMFFTKFISSLDSLSSVITQRCSFAISLISISVSFGIGIYALGNRLLEIHFLEKYGLGFSFRLDSLSLLMFTMISVLSFFIFKFSYNYMEGDKGKASFLGNLALTIGSVMLLVISGNLVSLLLSWILTSLSLNKLLLFYSHRKRALLAAKKKFVTARLSEFFLIVGSILLYIEVGSGNLEIIFNHFNSIDFQYNLVTSLAGVSLAISALLKSAQFPLYGWLIEVMETPTPVSALLHAGLLNAGPFLMVRFGVVMVGVESAQSLLIIIGGFTAFMASISYLTQPSVKTALGYSSMAHMGFMLLICGLGAYPAAMLHLVAHSFYKAHAFLSSGSMIDVSRSSKITVPKQDSNIFKWIIGLLLVISIHFGISVLFQVDLFENASLFITGLMIVMGLLQIISPAIGVDNIKQVFLKSSLMVVFVSSAFFALELSAHFLLSSQVPDPLALTPLVMSSISLILILFTSIVIYQSLGQIKYTNGASRLGIMFRNGFYANAYFDKWINAIKK